jgi:hypothetical protein
VRIPRINLTFSDELYEAVVHQARRAGLSPAAFARECVAWRVGLVEGADTLEKLRKDLAAVRRRLDMLERGDGSPGDVITAAADRDRRRLDTQQQPAASPPPSQPKDRGA